MRPRGSVTALRSLVLSPALSAFTSSRTHFCSAPGKGSSRSPSKVPLSSSSTAAVYETFDGQHYSSETELCQALMKMNEHLAFLRKRLHYAENDLKSVIASFDVGLRTVTDVTNAQKMTDDARTELELYQKGKKEKRTDVFQGVTPEAQASSSSNPSEEENESPPSLKKHLALLSMGFCRWVCLPEMNDECGGPGVGQPLPPLRGLLRRCSVLNLNRQMVWQGFICMYFFLYVDGCGHCVPTFSARRQQKTKGNEAGPVIERNE
ncbi:hypothetical protein CDAR_488021 [Caerostris darwini]|uniref:Uncharacterized protein n=1 Tax=Caerostris darwini TaxID=1538125 RepID=A0AAV4MAN0_9ARAC|nr:hypothetical protein CDAR_488021 [Caerostris darwini]